MTKLQHVSLFSGVGGIDLAFDAAGMESVAACEIDKHARGVLADRFPTTHLFEDVKDVTGDDLRALGADPNRTVLSGGFPCQDVSVAGRRRGMGEGTRSGLYWEIDRILGEFRPAWVVLENVPGLLSACCACPGDGTCEDRGLVRECPREDAHSVSGGSCWGECIERHGGVMGAVLGSLAERGYGFAYRVLDAQHFGVPQRRRRVFIVGRLGDDGRRPVQVLLEPEGLQGDPCAGITPQPLTPTSTRAGARDGRVTGPLLAHHGRNDPDTADQLVVGVRGDIAHTLTAEGHDASEDGTGRGTPVIAFHHQQDPVSSGVSPALGARSDGMGIATFQKVVRSGARDEDGGLPPDVWEERDQAATLSPFDLGSESRAVELVLAPTLTAANNPSRSPQSGEVTAQVEAVLAASSTVRRLTPRECERLQGWPDGHTATSNGKPQSDAQRYKQAGNGVASPVAEWIGRRIVAITGEAA